MGEIEKAMSMHPEPVEDAGFLVGDNDRLDVLCNDAIAIIDSARQNAYRAVNTSMVHSYYELGRRIVEEEQGGSSRAGYGTMLLDNLSKVLTDRFGRGFSKDNLKLMRRFYLVFSEDSIGETVFPQSAYLPKTAEGRVFPLSWSHYVKLMRIQDVAARHFYEIEAARQGWSLSEPNRQYDSALYERLALSSDKDKVMSLAREGQIVETPVDLIKDPYILEFTGLDAKASYSESAREFAQEVSAYE